MNARGGYAEDFERKVVPHTGDRDIERYRNRDACPQRKVHRVVELSDVGPLEVSAHNKMRACRVKLCNGYRIDICGEAHRHREIIILHSFPTRSSRFSSAGPNSSGAIRLKANAIVSAPLVNGPVAVLINVDRRIMSSCDGIIRHIHITDRNHGSGGTNRHHPGIVNFIIVRRAV